MTPARTQDPQIPDSQAQPPGADDPRWRRALTSDEDLCAAALSTRLLVSRLRREVRADPACLEQKAEELRAFFRNNADARPDLARL